MTAPCVLQDVYAGYGAGHVLNGASLTLPAGSITGLLGRNGAGKSTLMRVALGLLPIESGVAELFGEEAAQSSGTARQSVGYVPQYFDEFGVQRVREVLQMMAGFYRNRWDAQRVQALQEAWGLGPQTLSELSVGERQKVAILMGIGHQPDLLVLDEPVASLDPAARREFLAELVEMNLDSEQTVLLSSHITSDIERIASHVAIMKDGVVVLHEELDELRESVRRLTFADDAHASALPEHLAVLARIGNQVWVRSEFDAELPGLIARDGFALEDFFLAVTA